MSWQLAIGLCVLASTATSLVRRHYSLVSSVPASFPPAISYLLGVMPVGIIVGLSLSHHIEWTWWIILLFASNSATIAIANWLLFKGVKGLPAGQFQVINQFHEIVVIVLGWIFLQEKLNTLQLSGAFLLFIAALIAIRASTGSKVFSANTRLSFGPVVVTTIGATLFGASLVIEKAALGHMDLGAYLIFGWGAQTLAMLAFALKDVDRRAIRQFSKHEIKWSGLLGWLNGLAGVLYAIALVKSDNISLVSALLAIVLPLVAISAYFVLKERDNLKLLWASILLGTIGLVITGL